MSEAVRSALVVLHPGEAGDTPQRAAEVPPATGVAHQVIDWFVQRGFEVGPFVGISFAISGTADLFDQMLGVDPAALSGGPDLSMDRLDEAIAPHVAAVTTTSPPDFGPGNP